MTYDPNDRASVTKRQRQAKVNEHLQASTIKQLASDKSGRLWLWSQLEAAHIFATSFSTNAMQMAFAEGERNQGLRLLTLILEHCPDQFILMMREANERSATDRDERRNGPGDPGPELVEPDWSERPDQQPN